MKAAARNLLVVGVTILSFVRPAGVSAEDWPQWRGPNRDDISAEKGLLTTWPEGGPKRVWLSDVSGLGYSGPAIVGDRIYILGARDGAERLFCLSVEDGSEVWAAELGPIYENGWGDGPRSTPTVDGDTVYALSGQGNLVSVGAKDGQVHWTQPMTDLGGKIPKWGYSESPLVLGDKLLCTPGGEQGAIVALNRENGEPIWQTADVTDEAHYSSIMPAAEGSIVQLLVSQLVGLDPADGSLLWSVPWPGAVAVVPTPIIDGKQVYATSGYGAGCMLVKIGDENNAEQVYANKTMVNHHGGVIRVGDHVYGYSDGKGWMCQEFATGEQAWREKEALGKGAIAYADGHFYCLSEDEGEVVLIDASPEGWQERGRFTLDPQTEQRSSRGKIWTHPVIADGRLYLRDQEYVYCYDIRPAQSALKPTSGQTR